MATITNFKDIIDLPEWRPLAVANTANIAAAPMTLCSDLRNDWTQDPYIYKINSTSQLEKYHTSNDEWILPTTTGLLTAGAAGVGAALIFAPSQGPMGGVDGTPTTTSFTLSALPNGGYVGINQLANMGDGVGYKIRVIANGAGHSGKTEVRTIVANTEGTTPVVTLDSALSFTPDAGDHYEIISGTIYILGSGTTAAGFWRGLDIATFTTSSTNLSIGSLTSAIGTETAFVMMDEQYVPYNRKPGEGLINGAATYSNGCCNAISITTSDLTTLTASGMEAILENEYRNFQIRIVEDTTAPTSVGQRRKILTHTAGAAGVFTIASATSWSVLPSIDSKFVVELNNDVMLWTGGNSITYSFAAAGFNTAQGSWATVATASTGLATRYAPSTNSGGAGSCAAMAFSIVPDVARNTHHSFIYKFKGATSMVLDVFDIAGGTSGTWATLGSASFGGTLGTNILTGTSLVHDTAGNQGRFFYINLNGTQRFMRFDMLNRCLQPWCYLRYAQSTAITGNKLSTKTFIDGNTKLTMLYAMRHTGNELFGCLLQR
jgi:hypothetical protein